MIKNFLGLEQSGLPGTIAASIALLPEDLQGMFWANIGVIGGNTKFAGFHERLYVIPVARISRVMVLMMNQHDGASFSCSGGF